MTKQNLLTLKKMIDQRKLFINGNGLGIKIAEEVNTLEKLSDFISDVYEIAYGDSAIDKDYSSEEVLETLRGYSDRALYTEQLMEEEDFHKENYQEFLKKGYL